MRCARRSPKVEFDYHCYGRRQTVQLIRFRFPSAFRSRAPVIVALQRRIRVPKIRGSVISPLTFSYLLFSSPCPCPSLSIRPLLTFPGVPLSPSIQLLSLDSGWSIPDCATPYYSQLVSDPPSFDKFAYSYLSYNTNTRLVFKMEPGGPWHGHGHPQTP